MDYKLLLIIWGIGTIVALLLLFVHRRSLWMEISSIVSVNLACFFGYQFVSPYLEGVRLENLRMNVFMFVVVPIAYYIISFLIYLLAKGVSNRKKNNKEEV
ncbi:MAG: hypothetical protein LBR30_07990 [Clostridioides sp.]|nr:hypothetical protein [Clostridioides sp.]